MEGFGIRVPQTKDKQGILLQYSKELRSASAELNSIRRKLRSKISLSESIGVRLGKINDRIDEESQALQNYSDGLENIIVTYQQTENKIAGTENASANGLGEILKQLWEGTSGAVLGGAISGGNQSGDIKGTLSGELLGYSTKGTVTSGVKWKEKDGKYELDSVELIKAEGKAEVHLAKGKAEGNIGLLSGGIEGTLGQVAATGAVVASLCSEGELNPQIGISAEVKATAASGKAETELGTDNTNMHGEAKGELLTAKAKAEAAVGKVSYEDSSGNTVTGYGATGEVGAEAYLAKGEVSGGITIFGIDIDISLGGKAGGAGVKAEGHVTTGGVGGSVGLGLGLGAEIGINIDWSNFKFGW